MRENKTLEWNLMCQNMKYSIITNKSEIQSHLKEQSPPFSIREITVSTHILEEDITRFLNA